MAENLRKKSPRAPSIALEEALERAIKVYDCERLHPAAIDVVAKHLGYKNANNGAALGVLATLRYFGLLERPKEGMLAVTKEVESYRYAPDAKLRHSLLLVFLKQPALYRELLEKYDSGLPSDENLKHEMIVERRFAPQSAESALVIFKASVTFANYFNEKSKDDKGDEGIQGEKSPSDLEAKESERIAEKVNSSSFSVKNTIQAMPDGSASDHIPVRLSGGRKAQLIIPTPFYDADKARLKAQIDLLLTDDEGN